MRRTLLGLHTLVATLACGPGSSTSTGTDSTTSDPATGSADAGGTGGTAGSGTTGGIATENMTTDAPTGPGMTGETTPGITTGTATDGPGSTSDTGGSSDCAIINDGDYGECDVFLGWAFSGLECRAVYGCECAPDCDKFFPVPAACALTCAAAGECNGERIEGKYLGKNPVEVGDLCDGVHACLAGPDVSPEVLEAIWGAQTCEGGQNICDTESSCQGPFRGQLDAEMFEQLCAISLLTGVEKVLCVVWGP